jgi:hypothetical protein
MKNAINSPKTRLGAWTRIVSVSGFNGNAAILNKTTMNRTLETVIRDQAAAHQDSPVGMQFTVRVLEDHPDHLDVYIRPENLDGETVDFAIAGDTITIYKED